MDRDAHAENRQTNEGQTNGMKLIRLSPHSFVSNLRSIFSYRFVLLVAVLLLASGLFHLLKFFWDGSEWSGPLSIRKPILFGISTGVTTWSIAWLMTQLLPRRMDRLLVNAIAGALLLEVGLITLQYWRGVPSHFNHGTIIDALIEGCMLALILFVTLCIVYLTIRSYWLRPMDGSMVIAIRSGMWFLSLSCLLGILTSVFGEVSIASGGTSEVWGKAGVLKFPHGVALHAIQLFPLLSWVLHRLRVTNCVRVMQSLVVAQLLFLAYAIWQTLHGRGRFDWDATGLGMLLAAGAMSLYPVVKMAQAVVPLLRKHRSKSAKK